MAGYYSGGLHRRSIRLRDHDYAAGVYFVTICAAKNMCLFGEVVGGRVRLNEVGRAVAEEWVWTGFVREYVVLDAFVVMPNHVHGIVTLWFDKDTDTIRDLGESTTHHRKFGGLEARTLAGVVGAFKAAATRYVNRMYGTPGESLWHRNYYEHIIRNEDDLERIREYIRNNPLNWDKDEHNLV
ncbi:MAG TPA: transposase [Chloroflexia bacterium]|jgi:REP element-mobilizing transposase RayT